MFPPPTPLSPPSCEKIPAGAQKDYVWSREKLRSNVTAATIFAASRPAMKGDLTPTRTSVKWSSANRDTNETTSRDVAGLSGSLGRLSVISPTVGFCFSERSSRHVVDMFGAHHRLRPLGRDLGAVGCVKSPPSGSAWIWQEPCQRCCSLHAEYRWGKKDKQHCNNL